MKRCYQPLLRILATLDPSFNPQTSSGHLRLLRGQVNVFIYWSMLYTNIRQSKEFRSHYWIWNNVIYNFVISVIQIWIIIEDWRSSNRLCWLIFTFWTLTSPYTALYTCRAFLSVLTRSSRCGRRNPKSWSLRMTSRSSLLPSRACWNSSVLYSFLKSG